MICRCMLIAVWGVVAVYGLIQLYVFQATPGEAAEINVLKEMASPDNNSVQQTKLILFGHPRCPCMRTSLTQLKELVLASPDKVQVKIVFVCPQNGHEDWMKSATTKLAFEVPNAQVIWDRGAKVTDAFGARTSGHLLAFDARGDLKFNGGITSSRGHVGESAGATKLRDILQGKTTGTEFKAPVFGCRLFGGTLCRESGTEL